MRSRALPDPQRWITAARRRRCAAVDRARRPARIWSSWSCRDAGGDVGGGGGEEDPAVLAPHALGGPVLVFGGVAQQLGGLARDLEQEIDRAPNEREEGEREEGLQAEGQRVERPRPPFFRLG